MKLIPLTQDKFAIVDDEDYDYLMLFKWHAVKLGKGNYYAARRTGGKTDKKTIYMHRFLLGIENKDLVVDHRNHNGLDNSRDNIRVCSQRDNTANKRPHGKASKYLGVGLYKRDNKFYASIRHKGKSHYLGVFTNEKDAALAYNVKSTQLNGEFANLNVIT